MPSTYACPRDGQSLESRAAGSAEVHVCSSCHGLWISGYDLARLLKSQFGTWKLPWPEVPESGVTVVDDTARCNCEAGSLMKTVKRKGIKVDLCPECRGVWFDGGELEELVRKKGGKSYKGDYYSYDPEDLETAAGRYFVVEIVLNALVLLFD